jgi:lysophospholipase L1-like esterase
MKVKLIALLLVFIAILSSIVYIKEIYLPQSFFGTELRLDLQRYYDSKVLEFEKENATIEKGSIEVAFIGDSLTDHYDVKRFYEGLVTINRGIAGDNTYGLERRLQVSLYDVQPKVVVLLIGSNNLCGMMDNYERILISMRENMPNTHIVIQSVPPMDGILRRWNNGIIAYNNVEVKALAEKYGCEFVDTFTHLLDHDKNVLRAEYTYDGLHFVDAGYEVITAEIRPVLDRLLEK